MSAPKDYAFSAGDSPESVTLADAEDVVNFEVGMTWTPAGRLGFASELYDQGLISGHAMRAIITSIDRTAGTFTVSSMKLAETIKAAAPLATPLQVATTTAVAMAGLGFIIARRNLLAGSEDDTAWFSWVGAWLSGLIRGLLGGAEPKEET